MSNNAVAPVQTSIIKTSITLGVFALLAALLLGLVNLSTADKIQEQQLAAERRALDEVLPPSFHDNDLLSKALTLAPQVNNYTEIELLELSVERQAYIAVLGNTFAGAILPVEAHDGYSGDINLLVAILADGTVSGVRVLAHRETPGLGDKIDIQVSSWILGFDGKSLASPLPAQWQVIKDGGEFDQLVGATITPRSVINAVHRALQFFQLNRSKLESSAN
jgi:Na+-translocating ferredoxin:NAD+ oxidoreductase subunit G